MQHLRKSEKNKDHEILSKAIVRASNNTVIPHAEETGQKFLIRYFTENSAVEEILKHQGGNLNVENWQIMFVVKRLNKKYIMLILIISQV